MTLKVGAANYVCHYTLLIKYMYRAENWLLDNDNKAILLAWQVTLSPDYIYIYIYQQTVKTTNNDA